jgi:peptidylprolyl isomerase
MIARMAMARMTVAVAALALAAAACGGTDEGADGARLVDDDSTSSSTTTTAPVSETSTTAAAVQEGTPADGDTVTLHYTGTLDNGEQFDSSVGRDPFSFVIGSGSVIPGFDAAVRDMQVGDKKTVRIPAAEAYGERDEALVFEVPIDQAPEGLAVGDRVQSGSGGIATVIAVSETTVTVDANPALAGEALTFELELLSIS